ncbi:DegT/DnrJ/EryC1/StrS family aminotransferase [Cyclobacterium jeungdonense]|uniref:DegT/DnrJ/EryC1/StrS family aminotransferase n=1 Tax=Cyclobacterium jeungdonense TaxID=708087 RepID=A0ABT8C427_9BACT|nr:DegT/DnrJ/EryC1/StrS family aminotransferase [Cyclobacterium jeungdonense]MDN3686523.1 DegT/DnrJ/EryC1/StrS family aminotransferase [Cyclobacterium jeungdonense]
MKIQMVDLFSQYNKIKSQIDIGIQEVIDTSTFINGPQVNLFADELETYNQVEHVIPCANGTDALQIAMMALGFKAGQEVIVPAFTYVATVEVIALLGLIPVFIDVNPDTFELDVQQLEMRKTSNTVGIIPVHLYGQCSNMEFILSFAKENNLKVIEDAAQAIGADYMFSSGSVSKAGTMGEIGITSFFPSKNLGCFGDGGAMFTNDKNLAEKLKIISNHGQKKKYVHESIGVNSRLDTIQAAILRVKLKHLDEYSKARNLVAEKYDKEFSKISEIKIPTRVPNSTHVFHQYTIQVKGEIRQEFKDFLQENGIPSMIYYPIPLHMQVAYQGFGYKEGDFPVAEDLCTKVLSLPIHTEMKSDEQDYIIHTIKKYFNG